MAKKKLKISTKSKPKLSDEEKDLINIAKVTKRYFESKMEQADILEMEYMLNKGSTYAEIWDELKRRGYFLEVTHRTISERLAQYKAHILKPRLIADLQDREIYNEIFAMRDKVDTLKEFTLLVLHQRGRVQRKVEMERKLEMSGDPAGDKISNQVRKEIKVLGDLLEKLAKIQLETGALKRAPKYLSGTFEQDENDPSKLRFEMKEDYMEILEAIDAEFVQIPESEE